MRIISGTHRGKQLNVPKDLVVRPTTDYAKSGLFNILAHRFQLKKLAVVDLFAGTGSLSYEFISRGCTNVIAIDKDPACIRFIKQSFEQLDPSRNARAIQSDALKWLRNQPGKFDIIIADAPFEETPAEELSSIVADGELLNPNGVLIIEHASKNSLVAIEGYVDTRKYGNVSFHSFNPSKQLQQQNPSPPNKINTMSKIALFPGSFDPITIGHVDVITRSLNLFDKVIVGVGENTSKKYMFPLEDRVQWIKDSFTEYDQVEVLSYSGLTIDFCKGIQARFILRGLRTSADFEFERAIAQMNHYLDNGIETTFMLASPQYSPVSSTIIRDIIRNGGNATPFVGEGVKLK